MAKPKASDARPQPALQITDARIAGPVSGEAAARRAVDETYNRTGSVEVPVRLYEPAEGGEPWATIVWAHGGSFVRGSLDWPEADWVARRFAEAGMRVYSVDYVLASDEVKAPAPANDVAAVLREVRARHNGPLLVGGASAGGHLAAAATISVAQQSNHSLRPDALLLAYPTLHRVHETAPEITRLTAALSAQKRFGAAKLAEMYSFYFGEASSLGEISSLGETSRVDDHGLVPVGELPAAQLALLSPTVIVNAEADDLRASAEQFAEQLRAAGVPVVERVQSGTRHGYLNSPEDSARAERDAHATIESLLAGAAAVASTARNEILVAKQRGAREPAISKPTSLTSATGNLHASAVGWATQPIIDTSGLGPGLGTGRNKRWEYWNVTTPTHIAALTVSHIDYACVHEVWVYDRETGATWGNSATVIAARGAVLASTLEQGRSMARARNLAIDIDEVEGGTRLRFEIPGASLDVIAQLPDGHERLALVMPWSETRFQYTVKDLARPTTGLLRLDGVDYEIGGDAGEAWAVLDHGRGRWPYNVEWNWGAGSGRCDGRVLGLQVGAKWTAGSGVSENAFFVDGLMRKIHGQTWWQYNLDDWRAAWRVTGGGLDATFEPFHNKQTRTDLLVLQNHTDQCFGRWSGRFTTEAGETIEFAGLDGWAEAVHNRW